jgi:hypothetical protein
MPCPERPSSSRCRSKGFASRENEQVIPGRAESASPESHAVAFGRSRERFRVRERALAPRNDDLWNDRYRFFDFGASGSFCLSRAMPSQGSAESFFKRSARLRTVYSAALSIRGSSAQVTGAETGAPGRARVE